MKTHSLIKLLRSFSKTEIKEFDEFLSVAYFNKRRAVKQLYGIIKKHYPGFDNEGIEGKNISSKLFPGKKYNESSLRVLLHYLYELAKKFIAIKSFENNELEYDLVLMSDLYDRNHLNNFDKILEKSRADLDPVKYESAQFFYNKFRIEYEYLFYNYQSHSGVFEKFLEKTDLPKIFNDVSVYYYVKSLKLYLNIINLEIIYKKQFDKTKFEIMFTQIDTGLYEKIPIVEIYYNMVKMLTVKDNEKYYFRIKELTKENKKKIFLQDLAEIYINLTNYCKRKVQEKKLFFLKEQFDLLREEIKLKLYLVNKQMSPIYYRNFVTTGLELQEYTRVKDFLRDFTPELPEVNRDNTFYFCSALYERAMKNFDNSLAFLSRMKFDDVYQKYESKILQIIIYYETDAGESLLSSLEAFRHFLQSNILISDNKKQFYSNFYKYFKRLLVIQKRKDKYELIKFKNELLSQDKVNNKKWLLEKADDILTKWQADKNLRIA